MRGTTDYKMVPEFHNNPPKAAAAIQLEDNVSDWAGFTGPSEKTWVRGTTDFAMVPEYHSFPPKAEAPADAKKAAPAAPATLAKIAAPVNDSNV